MTTVNSTVQWLESSLQSPPGFRIPFKSSQSKTSLPSSSPSAPPWPWTSCWPLGWPGGYWGRPGSGPGRHIYFIIWTFQIGRAAAGKEKRKICLFKFLSSVELSKTSKPFEFFSLVTIWVFEFSHNLSLWALTQFAFRSCDNMSFDTI